MRIATVFIADLPVFFAKIKQAIMF